jgi:hypothetical protein
MTPTDFTKLDAVADAIMHDIIAEDIRLEQRRPKHAKRTVPAPCPCCYKSWHLGNCMVVAP